MNQTSLELPVCHSRREFDSQRGIYFCAHPQVHAVHNLVTAGVCRVCPQCHGPAPKTFRQFPSRVNARRDGPCLFLGEQTGLRDCSTCSGNVRLKEFQCLHPEHDTTIYRECELCFDYESILTRGGVTKWAVGITTASRSRPTLERCLASAVGSGWNEPRIFAEPGSAIPREYWHLPVTWRESVVGAWPNWYLGLAELYLREPEADGYLMLQDDALLCRNVRRYLEQALWPASRVGVVSIYTPSTYDLRGVGFHQVNAEPGLIGALAFVFSASAVRSLFTHAATWAHRLIGPVTGLKDIDAAIGRWSHARSLPTFYHTPSLAQHIGDHSTLWPDAANDGGRTASTFVGETFDAMRLLAS